MENDRQSFDTFLKELKEKYKPEHLKVQEEADERGYFEPSRSCLNSYALSLGKCAECGWCGRTFEDGKLTHEAGEK